MTIKELAVELLADYKTKKKKNRDYYYDDSKTQMEKRVAYDEWHSAEQKLVSEAPDTISELLATIDSLETIVAELINELSPHNTEHKKLIVKGLRACGFTDSQIKLWFAGEILF